MKIKNDLLEELNVIQNYSKTYFYVTLETNPIRYGVAINIKDIDKKQEIIDLMKTNRKEQIEMWNEEQRERNIRGNIK